MSSNWERPLDRVKHEEELRKRLIRLKNEYLEIRLRRLELLKKHYEQFWIDLDLQEYESRLDSITARTQATMHHVSRKKVDELTESCERDIKTVDTELSEAEERLKQFNNLDRSLLAEYRKIRDDIECQNLLVELSENNAQT